MRPQLNHSMEQTYKCVVALNNHGITLLERRCFEQGLATLRDAMDALRSLMAAWETSSRCTVDVERYLQDCFLRLANPRSTKQCLDFHIHTLTGDLTHQLPNKSGQMSIVNPIRVDDLSFDASSLGDDLDLTAAIVMHNFAIANWFASKAFPPSVSPLTTLHLLQLSNQVLDKLQDSCEEELQLRQIACINVVVIWSLLHFLLREAHALGKEESNALLSVYAHLTERVLVLRGVVSWIDQIFSYWTSPPSLAAAA